MIITALEVNHNRLPIMQGTAVSDIETFIRGARKVTYIDDTGREAWTTNIINAARILDNIHKAAATFQAGTTYQTGNMNITILHRTRCYATIAGYGRRLIREWPTGGEVVLIPVGKKCDIFCFAWNEANK